jgi:hypothetical protein
MKRKFTIALDDPTAAWARVEAAKRNTSVSDLVGSLLHERMQQDRQYEVAMTAYLAVAPAGLKHSGAYPARAEVHERGHAG